MTVVWITGLPASGKSTLARAIAARLRERGRACVLLDGDEVRAALVPSPGYRTDARDAFYETLANLAALIAGSGVTVVVAATSPRQHHRDTARRRASRFVEVYVRTPLEECVRRDPRGLYARAAAGALPDVPGMGAAYDVPESPEVTAVGGADEVAVAAVLDRL